MAGEKFGDEESRLENYLSELDWLSGTEGGGLGGGFQGEHEARRTSTHYEHFSFSRYIGFVMLLAFEKINHERWIREKDKDIFMLAAYSDITRSQGIGRRISHDDPTRNIGSVFPVTKLGEACTGEERVGSESVVFGHEYKFDGNGLLGGRGTSAIGQ
jgi:hypothetical protein